MQFISISENSFNLILFIMYKINSYNDVEINKLPKFIKKKEKKKKKDMYVYNVFLVKKEIAKKKGGLKKKQYIIKKKSEKRCKLF